MFRGSTAGGAHGPFPAVPPAGFPRDPLAPSPLRRIVAAISIIGVLFAAFYSLVEGSPGERFVQIGLAVGALVYLLTFVDILIGIGFLIACIAMSPELSLGGVGDLRLEDFLTPALLLSWLGRSMRDRERVIATPLAAPAMLYLGAMTLSTLIGVSAGTTQPGRSFAVLMKYAEYYVLFLLIVNNVRTPREFKAVALFALFAAAASALLASRPSASPGDFSSVRPTGPEGETANIYGGFLVLHLGLACSLLVFARTAFLKVASLASVLAMGSTVMGTLSRTSYASFAIGLTLVGVLLERRLLALLLAAGVFFFVLAPDQAADRAGNLMTVAAGGSHPSLDARFQAWEMISNRMTGTRYLLGHGAGSIPFADADSEYFRILADTGMLGLALFGWILLRIGRMAWAAYRAQPRETFGYAYAVGFLVSFVAILIHAFAATSFTSIRTMEGFVILCGLTAVLHHRGEEWDRPDSPPNPPPFSGR
jgi:hypothetical protein